MNIKEITFYTKGSVIESNHLNGLNEAYKEFSLKFDKEGLVYETTWFNRMGIPHSKNKFERDFSNKKVKSKSFIYLEESGKEMTSDIFPPTINDFFYDKQNRLIKSRSRGFKGEILPDSLTSYIKYKYDVNNRVVETESFTYYDWTKSLKNKASTRFNEKDFTSETKYFTNDTLIYVERSKFDANWSLIEKKSQFTPPAKSDESRKYDEKGRLVYLSFRSELGGSECPDDGNFEEFYTYNQNGTLEKILHKFDKYQCEITVK